MALRSLKGTPPTTRRLTSHDTISGTHRQPMHKEPAIPRQLDVEAHLLSLRENVGSGVVEGLERRALPLTPGC